MRRDRDEFGALVAAALDELPGQIRARLDNVEVLVADWPSREQRADAGVADRGDLFGLYEGVPLTERTADYGLVVPDRITIFRGPLMRHHRTEAELREAVQRTVIHELAHHFGIDDDRLEALGAY